MKLIIAGTRDFDNIDLLTKETDKFIEVQKHRYITTRVTVISGCATGADALGMVYAAHRGYEVEKYPALWDRYGRAAGPIRNRVMAQKATACIVFWDGRSPGTKNMIVECEKAGLPCRVIKYK